MASKARGRGRGLQEEDASWLNKKLRRREGMLAASKRMATHRSREAGKSYIIAEFTKWRRMPLRVANKNVAGSRILANPLSKRLKEEFSEGKRNSRALHYMREVGKSVASGWR